MTGRAANPELAARLHHLAVEAAAAARPAHAVRLLRQALRILPADGESVVLRIKVLVTLALAAGETASAVDGLTHLDQAERLTRLVPRGSPRIALLGLIHQQHAIIALRAGRTAAALRLLDVAIPLLELPGADPAVLTRAVLNRGLAHLSTGDPAAAGTDLRRCGELAREHDLPLVAAKAEHNLGDLAHLVGDIPAALRHYELAEVGYRTLAPGMIARLRLDRARAMLAAGLSEEAARLADEALADLRGHRVAQDLAEAEVVRASAALMDGDVPAARRFAASARRRFLRRGNAVGAELAALTRMRADAFDALFPWHERRSGPRVRQRVRPGDATALADRLAGLGLAPEAALARMLAVRLALRQRDTDTASELIGLVRAPKPTAPIDHRMLYRLCRAELALARGNTRSALAQARCGLAELSRIRDRMGGLDLLCGTAVHGWELGRLAMRQVIDAADPRRVLAWQERTRAQVYRYEPLPVIGDPEQAARIAELRTLIRATQQARRALLPTAQLEHRCAVLRREVERLGWATTPWGRPRPVFTPDVVADRLGERVLVSFASPGDRIDAVVLRDGHTTLVRLAGRAEVLALTGELHADLDALAPDHLLARLEHAVARSAITRADRLNALLLRPLLDLVGDRELVLVPLGGMFAVPWSVLPALRGRAVSVAPSATAWVNASLVVPHGGRVVLVRGPGLPDGLAELTALRAIYPDAVVLDGPAATAAAVLAAMDGADLVHVAAHGVHEPGNALFSRLELADGGLLAHEVARLRRPPRHIVLAACELALGRVRQGDEVLGFAGAMLAAGSGTEVAAVSRVGDRATAAAMADYHARLAAGARPASALAEVTAADPLHRPFVCLGAG